MNYEIHIRKFFDHWSKPVVTFITSLFIAIAGVVVNNDTIQWITFVIGCIGVFVMFSFSIYQWVESGVTGGILLIMFTLLMTFAAMVAMALLSWANTLIDGDHWADDLKIPDNIELNIPEERNSYDSEDNSDHLKSNLDFVLYNDGQPGMYSYDIWLSNIENGTIYLKAFEITKETPLSTRSLREDSSIEFISSWDKLDKHSLEYYFTIYEGDWGDFYAARFEVWFKPNNGGKERMLLKKNYKIQGWMH